MLRYVTLDIISARQKYIKPNIYQSTKVRGLLPACILPWI
jgi:hypothetical protein